MIFKTFCARTFYRMREQHPPPAAPGGSSSPSITVQILLRRTRQTLCQARPIRFYTEFLGAPSYGCSSLAATFFSHSHGEIPGRGFLKTFPCVIPEIHSLYTRVDSTKDLRASLERPPE